MPRRMIPSCSCSWLWSGTVAPGSNSIRFSIAPSPKRGRPDTPSASANARTSEKRTNCGSIARRLSSTPMAAREEIRVPGLAEPISHYTDAVRAGDLLFVSGCVPIDGEGSLVGGDDVVAQARQVLANVGAVLAAAGASFADVAKVTVYLKDVDDRARINPVRREVFGETRPASTLVEVSRLAIEGAKIEVEAVAVLRS